MKDELDKRDREPHNGMSPRWHHFIIATLDQVPNIVRDGQSY